MLIALPISAKTELALIDHLLASYDLLAAVRTMSHAAAHAFIFDLLSDCLARNDAIVPDRISPIPPVRFSLPTVLHFKLPSRAYISSTASFLTYTPSGNLSINSKVDLFCYN